MITRRVWFVLLPVGMFLAGGSAWTSVTTPPRTSGFVRSSTTVTDTIDRPRPTAAEPHMDVYGNEIEDAIGDYRIDPRGDVYERHSPDTEVPRLGPPII